MPEKKYQTVRIYQEDHDTLKELSFYQKKSIVELMSEATKHLKTKYHEKV